MSTTSVAMSWLSRCAVLLTVISTLALVTVLVLYFREIAIPPLLMVVGLYGLPLAFVLGIVVVIYYIRQRRNS